MGEKVLEGGKGGTGQNAHMRNNRLGMKNAVRSQAGMRVFRDVTSELQLLVTVSQVAHRLRA